MRVILIFSLVFSAILAGVLSASEIANPVSCRIVQYNQGRLYFSAGEEARIYPHAKFTVLASPMADTVVTGYIEHSWIGISASFPLDSIQKVTATDDLVALIEPAAVDSSSTITIGTDIAGLRWYVEDSSDNRLEVRRYQHHSLMEQDFRSGELDGCLSFRKPRIDSREITVMEQPLPYIAVLIPNIGREANARGLLTTSLYYRFDHARPGLYFEGSVVPRMCLRLTHDGTTGKNDAETEIRPYPLDPERGRRLIENMTGRPTKVSIYYGSPDLERLAHYFGDILARDRFEVEITDHRRAADLYLEFLPLSSDVPATTVYAVQHKLERDSIPGSLANEPLKISAGFADLLESAGSRLEYYSYLDRMSRLLITDLGVFPLFRPTAYFGADRNLQGVRFDPDGYLDITTAVKVIPPGSFEGAP